MNIWITRGLHNEFFVDEYSRIGNGTKKTIFRIDSNYHLSPVLEDIFWGESVSVDFSRKGYVRAVVGLYSFYDADFNFRKQRYTEELFFTFHETHTPFGKNWILEQTVQPTSTKPERGLQIRIIDSNLVIKKKIIFFPDENLSGTMYMPFYGGIDIQNENEIWSTGEFYHGYPPTAPSYYMITKLDSNLNIICHHFLGYDTHYRLFGIRAFESGGAMIFGRRLKEGEPINEGEDIFALRVGENCELPVVAVSDPEKPMIAISAYPNPAINSLTFDVQGFDPAALRVEFITATGTVVFTRQDLRYEIRVADLPTGQYFYRILEQDKLLGVGSWVKQ